MGHLQPVTLLLDQQAVWIDERSQRQLHGVGERLPVQRLSRPTSTLHRRTGHGQECPPKVLGQCLPGVSVGLLVQHVLVDMISHLGHGSLESPEGQVVADRELVPAVVAVPQHPQGKGQQGKCIGGSGVVQETIREA